MLVAKVGACVFAGVLGMPAMLPGASVQASVMVAGAAALAQIDVSSADVIELPEVRLPVVAQEPAVASSTQEPPVAAAVAPVAPPAPLPPPEPLVLDGVVVASWYGPGFFGNRTACGQTYTPEILGVAHRLLPCGTAVKITSPAGVTVVVPVIDRGPYVAGRHLDLSSATKLALRCSDLCHVVMTVLR